MPEAWLLKLRFLQEDTVGWAERNLDPAWIQNASVRDIVSRRLEAARAGSWQNLGAFLDGFDAPEMQNLITEAAAEQRPLPHPAQQLADVTLRLRNQFIDRQLQELMHQVNLPATDDSARVTLLRRQQELRELKRRPIEPPADG
jgi:hypothetical protein